MKKSQVSHMSHDIAELVDKQNEIIKAQSDIIDSLFLRLLQYEPAEELDHCAEVGKINAVAALRESIGT